LAPELLLGTLEKRYFAYAVSWTTIFLGIYPYSNYAVPAPSNYAVQRLMYVVGRLTVLISTPYTEQDEN
jgi:hypothetical protein